jgi:hypothetical protein
MFLWSLCRIADERARCDHVVDTGWCVAGWSAHGLEMHGSQLPPDCERALPFPA